ncbi:MAG TPA: aliphatic sulfonate ABC transporter substrate-binding protein, partial [Chthoniobacterales bacterium]
LLFEAFNANSLDFGHAADAPTAFAQAAGIPFVYVAAEPAYPRGLALLAPGGSAVQKVADLKGKRVAIGHGWNCEYQLVRALEEAGLQYGDVKPVYVKSAADARAVLESSSADAVGLWDPFYAVVELDDRPRVLRDGLGLTPNYTFLVASPGFAQERPQLICALLEELVKVDEWANQHPEEVAVLLSKDLGVNQEALLRATQRREYGVHPVDAETVAAQQRLADKFFEIGELPTKINVQKAVPAKPPWWKTTSGS